MKYRALLQRLKKMTPKQLDQDAMVYDCMNSYFPDGEVRINQVNSDDLQQAQRDGMVLEKGQILIRF